MEYQHRHSRPYDDGLVILSADTKATGHDAFDAIPGRHRDITIGRKKLQPQGQYVAGSVFKVAPQHADGNCSPGWLIDKAGLKGARVGGAFVSEQHANWIINDGTASSTDVLLLMRRIKECVHVRFGIQLVPEVRYIGQNLVG